MLLVVILAIYTLIAGRLRITRATSLEGTRARVFGVMLLVFVWPVRVTISRWLLPLFPASWWANRLILALANWFFLVIFVLATAVLASLIIRDSNSAIERAAK